MGNSEISGFRTLHQTGELFLTEAGLYKVIFVSRKKKAQTFQKWVFGEVLPMIRKTGSYSVNGESLELSKIKSANQGLPLRNQTFSTNMSIELTPKETFSKNIEIIEDAINSNVKKIVPCKIIDLKLQKINRKLDKAKSIVVEYPTELNQRVVNDLLEEKNTYIIDNGLSPERHKPKKTTSYKKKYEKLKNKIAKLEAENSNIKRECEFKSMTIKTLNETISFLRNLLNK